MYINVHFKYIVDYIIYYKYIIYIVYMARYFYCAYLIYCVYIHIYIYIWCISSDTYIENTSLFIYIYKTVNKTMICCISVFLRVMFENSPSEAPPRPAAGVSASNQCAVATSCQDLRCLTKQGNNETTAKNPRKPWTSLEKTWENLGKNIVIMTIHGDFGNEYGFFFGHLIGIELINENGI